MSSLRSILRKIKNELEEKEKRHENAQNLMRKATSLSKQAILQIHQKKTREANKLLNDAKKILSELNITSETLPEIMNSGSFEAARQEYSEATILLRIVEKSKLVTPKEIDVPSIDYVLGLADVIGECRRLALDAMREGNAKRAENYLKIMDEIYVELSALDEAYMLVRGLRRKCDVARKIIDITRGDVTQEVRRDSLERSLRAFERSIKRKTKL